MTEGKRRRPVSDRARRRAIRAHAARAGVPYSVAARDLDGSVRLETPAGTGRTLYPAGADEQRRWLVAARRGWSYDLRVRDTRLAVQLPLGRAEHLAVRFPSMRIEGHLLYDGEARETVLAMLYAAAGHERADAVPSTEELSWLAELGEEAAVDVAYASLDAAARALLDVDPWRLWSRIEAALVAAEASPERRLHWAAVTLRAELRSLALRRSVDGARHTLDALLVSSRDGHAPGTRVRWLTLPRAGAGPARRTGTIVGARWGAAGRPVAYEVRLDTGPPVTAAPGELTLAGPDADACRGPLIADFAQ